ncbi:hypothetical protein BGZ82_008612 [Podila clonocystis]|nr:hypothetical protein BGZ82_008612 [Podila clonocystis]
MNFSQTSDINKYKPPAVFDDFDDDEPPGFFDDDEPPGCFDDDGPPDGGPPDDGPPGLDDGPPDPDDGPPDPDDGPPDPDDGPPDPDGESSSSLSLVSLSTAVTTLRDLIILRTSIDLSSRSALRSNFSKSFSNVTFLKMRALSVST